MLHSTEPLAFLVKNSFIKLNYWCFIVRRENFFSFSSAFLKLPTIYIYKGQAFLYSS